MDCPLPPHTMTTMTEQNKLTIQNIRYQLRRYQTMGQGVKCQTLRQQLRKLEK